MSAEIIHARPPLVGQGNNHICWAAAYESWAQAAGISAGPGAAREMVGVLSQIGRAARSPDGPIVDRQERLLHDGLMTFAMRACMNLTMVGRRHFRASYLAAKLRLGYVWLWCCASPVSHVRVVYGINANGVVFWMDPLGNGSYRNATLHDLNSHFVAYWVGTPLFWRPPADIWAGLRSSEVHVPSTSNSLYP
jgi:hypothetical protein